MSLYSVPDPVLSLYNILVPGPVLSLYSVLVPDPELALVCWPQFTWRPPPAEVQSLLACVCLLQKAPRLSCLQVLLSCLALCRGPASVEALPLKFTHTGHTTAVCSHRKPALLLHDPIDYIRYLHGLLLPKCFLCAQVPL